MTQERLRAAIIGTGFGVKVQAPAFQRHRDFEVIALSSVRPGRGPELARELGIPRGYDDWRQMLKDGGFDLVSVVSAPEQHCEMSLAALEGGYHVLCEKPPALNLAEAQRMADAAARAGRAAAYDFEFRYYPARWKFRELVAAGYVGELLDVTVTWNWPDYDALLARPMSWWLQAEKGGGLLGALGSHLIDTLHWCFGPITRVVGDLRVVVPEHAWPDGSRGVADADDTFSFLCRFASGAAGTVRFHYAHHDFGLRILAHGREGTLIMHEDALRSQRVWAGKRGGPLREVAVPPQPYPPPADAPEYVARHLPIFMALLDRLAAACRGEAAPDLATFAGGARVQAVMDAVRAAAASGRWTDVPPT